MHGKGTGKKKKYAGNLASLIIFIITYIDIRNSMNKDIVDKPNFKRFGTLGLYSIKKKFQYSKE